MSSPPKALVAAIRAEPGADAPRLQAADWYEEKGQPERARFIRLQLERARLPTWHEDVIAIELQEREILDLCETKWRKSEQPKTRGIRFGPYERGFPRSASFDQLEVLAQHGEVCCAKVPIVELQVRWPRRGAAPDLPSFAGVGEITVRGTVMSAAELRWFAKTTLMKGVRRLSLIDSSLRKGLPIVMRSSFIPQLEAFRIPDHQFGTKGVEQLLSAPWKALCELDLKVEAPDDLGSGRRYYKPIDDLGVCALAVWPNLAAIRTIDLSGNQLGVGGLTALLSSAHAGSITELRIRDISDGDWEFDDSLTAFRHGPAGTLETLDIGDNDLNLEAAEILRKNPALSELRELNIQGLRAKNLSSLLEADWFDEVRVLHCSWDVLGAVFERQPRALHTLVVGPAPGRANIAPQLAKSPALPQIRRLDLRAARLTGEALTQLGKTSAMPGLEDLHLLGSSRAFSERDANHFARSSLGSQLRGLTTGYSSVDRCPAPATDQIGYAGYRARARDE